MIPLDALLTEALPFWEGLSPRSSSCSWTPPSLYHSQGNHHPPGRPGL